VLSVGCIVLDNSHKVRRTAVIRVRNLVMFMLGMSMTHNVSFWLVPSAADRGPLQALINQLAAQYGAPQFRPHVTLYAGAYTQAESPASLMRQATEGIQAFKLNVQSIAASVEFTKTLFLQLPTSSILHQISEAIRSGSNQPSSYVLDPHMSLLYHPINGQQRKTLVDSIPIPMTAITFDTVVAISYSHPVQTKVDVERWQEIDRHSLLPMAPQDLRMI